MAPMLPASTVPRAYMTVTGAHLPFTKSLAVALACLSSRSLGDATPSGRSLRATMMGPSGVRSRPGSGLELTRTGSRVVKRKKARMMTGEVMKGATDKAEVTEVVYDWSCSLHHSQDVDVPSSLYTAGRPRPWEAQSLLKTCLGQSKEKSGTIGECSSVS
jgi:hypothetical protein